MKKKNITRIALRILVLLPLWMYVAWLLTPKKKLVVAIVDKTVLTAKGQEHSSLTWVLNYNRFTKNKTDLYTVGNDYYGFFPMQDEKFRIKGLERFSSTQLEQLGKDADLVYLTDTYGIYRNEWYLQKNMAERSWIVYGGMSHQDMDLLDEMKDKHKLIITEFNCIGSPTTEGIRTRFEKSFGVRWLKWSGRYFASLDTIINPELPKWLIRNYEAQYGKPWHFTKSGIGFVSNSNQVVVLEDELQLKQPVPRLVTNQEAMDHFGLPRDIYYPYWFDITETDTAVNKITAHFELDLTDSGKKELSANGIPFSFPAIHMHKDKDYQFYYFSADFSDNPIGLMSSYFKGIGFFKFLFNSRADPADMGSFFWRYYRPLLSTILNEYYENRK